MKQRPKKALSVFSWQPSTLYKTTYDELVFPNQCFSQCKKLKCLAFPGREYINHLINFSLELSSHFIPLHQHHHYIHLVEQAQTLPFSSTLPLVPTFSPSPSLATSAFCHIAKTQPSLSVPSTQSCSMLIISCLDYYNIIFPDFSLIPYLYSEFFSPSSLLRTLLSKSLPSFSAQIKSHYSSKTLPQPACCLIQCKLLS